MPADTNNISFGRYLKSVREERGISLESVSEETRISMGILRAIEREDHARLPAVVFAKGFIRSYAVIVGADGDRAVRMFSDSRERFRGPVDDTEAASTLQSGLRPKLLAVLGAMVLLVAATLIWDMLRPPKIEAPVDSASQNNAVQPAQPAQTPLSDGQAPGEDDRDAASETTVDVQAGGPADASVPSTGTEASEAVDEPSPALPAPAPEPPSTSQSTETSEDMAQDGATPPKPHTLVVTAGESTWMKVILDGQKPVEYMLEKGDRLDLEATDGFNLLIGNAGGVSFVLDGDYIPPQGKSGQVVTLDLP